MVLSLPSASVEHLAFEELVQVAWDHGLGPDEKAFNL